MTAVDNLPRSPVAQREPRPDAPSRSARRPGPMVASRDPAEDAPDPSQASLSHQALFYDSPAAYGAAVREFVDAGRAAGEPVLIAAPAASLALIRDALEHRAAEVTFADMTELGANPARIIPAARDFFDRHPGQRARICGEPIWAGRSPAEVCEVMRHEALANVAFADTPHTFLCPYDVNLPWGVRDDAAETHPFLYSPTGPRESTRYLRGRIPSNRNGALPAPPTHAERLDYAAAEDLRGIRKLVGDAAARLGLSGQRSAELTVAVGEAAANTLCHSGGAGTVHVWPEADRLICHTRDGGSIGDLLAGRRRPAPAQRRARGLWLINQLCDLVELRSDATGTTIRMHMCLP